MRNFKFRENNKKVKKEEVKESKVQTKEMGVDDMPDRPNALGKGVERYNAIEEEPKKVEPAKTKEEKPKLEPQYKVEERKEEISKSKMIYITIILDKTISMTTIYAKVYSKLKIIIDFITKEAKRFRNTIQIKWGIVYITEEEPEVQTFYEGNYTISASKLKEVLRTVEFEGGSRDGRENINGAVEKTLQLFSIENEGFNEEEKARGGIILITDSMPKEEDCEPDFDKNSYSKLRFVNCYVYEKENYGPFFELDRRDVDTKKPNAVIIESIESFLNKDTRALTKSIGEILAATSVAQ